MLKRIKSYWSAIFIVIETTDQAKEMGLKYVMNIYGDAINHYDCRSFWSNEFGHIYRCKQPLYGKVV